MTLSINEVKEIAENYAQNVRNNYMYLELEQVRPSTFIDGYWDVGYKVKNYEGNEIDGPLLMAINDSTGKISTIDDIIHDIYSNE